MELNKIYHGSCMDVIKTFPDKSIDCVITSPPYWQLRDYGWSGQWGMEKTFAEYLEHLWELMNEIWRVLKDSGTVWINLGDSYSGSNGLGWKQNINTVNNSNGGGENEYLRKENGRTDSVRPKCLLLIPHRFAIGCIDKGWIMRNDIIWAKRNGMPESVIDRFSKKHEYFFFMSKSEKYYFDLDGIKDRTLTKDFNTRDRDVTKLNNTPGRTKMAGLKENNYDTKNPGSVADFWDIPTKGSNDKHYASYNTKLIDKPIVAGCPQYVCNQCGKAREKIIKNTPMVIKRSNRREDMGQPNGTAASGTMISPAINEIIGWTDCGCNVGFSGGIILDPFCGTATTGCRAIDLQRKFIGIEGKEEYVTIGNKKLLPFQITQQLF